MPPKPKFTKEEIAKIALDIIKEEGVDALTARNLGKRLGSSSRPIFTVYNNMQEVKEAGRAEGLHEFEEYASDFTEYTPAFKRIGMLMVSYAVNKPELFKLLFMQEHTECRSFKNSIEDLGGMADVCIKLICRDYDMSVEEAEILFEDMWVYTFGIGALSAMKVCDFTEEEIAKRLGDVFAGMVMVIKSGNINKTVVRPVKSNEESEKRDYGFEAFAKQMMNFGS